MAWRELRLTMIGRDEARGAISFVAAWVVANLLGWIVGITTAESLTWLAARRGLPWSFDSDLVASYAILVMLGITVGVGQWIVLRRRLPGAATWIPATMVGFLVDSAILIMVSTSPDIILRTEVAANLILLALMGLAIGLLQWWVLRQHVGRAGLWVLACGLSFLFFIWLVFDPAKSSGELLIRSGTVWAIASVMTGSTLAWMVYRPLARASHHQV